MPRTAKKKGQPATRASTRIRKVASKPTVPTKRKRSPSFQGQNRRTAETIETPSCSQRNCCNSNESETVAENGQSQGEIARDEIEAERAEIVEPQTVEALYSRRQDETERKLNRLEQAVNRLVEMNEQRMNRPNADDDSVRASSDNPPITRHRESNLEDITSDTDDQQTDSDSEGRQQNILLQRVEAPLSRGISFSAGVNIGDEVPIRIKEQIWSYKYIDFAVLLSPDTDQEYSLAFMNDQVQPTLKLRAKSKRTLKEHEWCDAFDTFLSVYTRKYPEQLNELLTYGQTIKGMMRRNENWRFYDKQFRTTREYSRCSWSELRVDLMLQAHSQSKKLRTESRNETTRKEQIPVGHCYRYHTPGRKCNNGVICSFKHSCVRCNKNHPMFFPCQQMSETCLLYTSDAADE